MFWFRVFVRLGHALRRYDDGAADAPAYRARLERLWRRAGALYLRKDAAGL